MTTVGATGHQDIPPEAVRFVEEGIRKTLQGISDLATGVCSLAAGADQLFAREVLRTGAQLRVVVPARGYEAAFENPQALQAYRKFVGEAAAVEILNHEEGSERAYLEAGQRVVDLSDILLSPSVVNWTEATV